MEKSKLSEEKILKLGKKIVNDLQINHSGKTLDKWMAHYISELIVEIDNESNSTIKEEKRKKCCDLILKIWENREEYPIDSPLDNYEDILILLDALKQNNYSYPHWILSRSYNSKSIWNSFVEKVKNLSNNNFKLCFFSSLKHDINNGNEEWLNEYSDLLSDSEEKILNHLSALINDTHKTIRFTNDSDINLTDLTEKERNALVIKKLENNLDEQKNELNQISEKLKEQGKL
jgi:hypothetical protein